MLALLGIVRMKTCRNVRLFGRKEKGSLKRVGGSSERGCLSVKNYVSIKVVVVAAYGVQGYYGGSRTK